MTNSTNITKPMIMRIWWAQTWRRYAFIGVFGGLIFAIVASGDFYTKQCFEGHCTYNLPEFVVLIAIMGLAVISMITHWITLNRTYPQITINGSHFTSRIDLKKGPSSANKIKAMLRFFWSYNWLYVSVSLAFLMLLSILVFYLSGFQKAYYASPEEESLARTTSLFAGILTVISLPVINYICSMAIMPYVLSKKFNAFEIRITPHTENTPQAETL